MKATLKLVVFLLLVGLCPPELWASNPAVQITWPGSYGRGTVQLSLTASDGATATNYTKTVPYGEYSTAASIAGALGAHISMSPDWPVWAKGFPDGSVQMIARSSVAISNLQICIIASGSSGCSSPPSGVTLATGTVLPNGPTLVDALYGFIITKPDGSSGYDGVGNVVGYQDYVNQQWSATYDSLNRLKSASQSILAENGSYFQTTTTSNGTQQYFCWNYDSFGNRTAQVISDVSFADTSSCQLQSSASPNASVATYDATNRITSGSGMTAVSYDPAGNLEEDGNYSYKYDADGRLCAVWTHVSGLVTGYLYDADGTRVAKGTQTVFSCDLSSNGFVLSNRYIPGPDGQQMTELDGAGNWVHTNIFADGSLVETDDSTDRHFQLNDWLGNRRMQVDTNSTTRYQAAPYGDRLNPSPPATTEHYFTGKERDTESGLDYFEARYYGSGIGRFTSPDNGEDQEAGNPQSWNLYSYVRNNPVTHTDTDGHSVNVCTNDAAGNPFCWLMNNMEYQRAQRGNSNLNVPTLDQVGMNGNGSGQFNSTAITDSSGNIVGTATYVSDGGADYYANRNGINTLATTSRGMNQVTAGYAVVFGAVGGAIIGGEVASATAASRSNLIFQLEKHGIGLKNLLRLKHNVPIAAIGIALGEVKNEIAMAVSEGRITMDGTTSFEGVVNVAGTYIKFTGAFTQAGTVISNVMGKALIK